MRWALKIASGVNVAPLHNALLRNPQLWNEHPERGVGPHVGVDDIWVRYNAPANFDAARPAAFNEPHESVWYPAHEPLRCLDAIVFPLMASVQAERLGGVLITRIPPGREVKWHTDRGWHAEHYDKYAVQIAANAQQAWHCEDGVLITQPGDVFWFNNQAPHRVTNKSAEDRITMIVCLRHSRGGS